ncbi:MAG: hypothetical protein CME19_10895 [Gemmatimonadetes bacterium]|nr:hypothetical protein [Gemmatimonadota bacterium]
MGHHCRVRDPGEGAAFTVGVRFVFGNRIVPDPLGGHEVDLREEEAELTVHNRFLSFDQAKQILLVVIAT